MPLLANIVGFSLFGLAARFGQLGIQQRNIFSNPGGHLVAVSAFGYLGYWAYKWEERSNEILKERALLLKSRREEKAQQQEAAAALA